MLYFSVTLMNRLNKTESVIFDLCRISLLLKNLLFRMFLCVDSFFTLYASGDDVMMKLVSC